MTILPSVLMWSGTFAASVGSCWMVSVLVCLFCDSAVLPPQPASTSAATANSAEAANGPRVRTLTMPPGPETRLAHPSANARQPGGRHKAVTQALPTERPSLHRLLALAEHHDTARADLVTLPVQVGVHPDVRAV